MASTQPRRGKHKTSWRVIYSLWVDGKKEEAKEPFDLFEDAKAFETIAEVIESKSKRNLASPAEVALWVEQKYIKRKSAAKAFPLYRDSLLNKGESFVDIDWELIKETYATKRLFKASDKDDIGENHLNKMTHFDRVKEFLVKRHPDLRVSKTDVQSMLLELQNTGYKNGPMRANTRAHWLYAFRMIFEVAEELQMMTGGNPTDDVTVSIPSRPKYVVRVILDQETAKKMLKTSRDMLDSTYIEQLDSLDYTRPKPRVPHPLSRVSIPDIWRLPEEISRSELMDALDISIATLKRYVQRGILPKSIDKGGGDNATRWVTSREEVLRALSAIQDKNMPRTKKVQLPAHRQMMRGAFPLALRLGLWAGLRNGEAVWLPWKHVDLDERTIYIGQVRSPLGTVWSPKTEVDNEEGGTSERVIELNPDLCNYFTKEKERQESLGLKTFFVFPSGRVSMDVEHGKPLSRSVLNRCFQKVLQISGCPKQDKMTFYSLRHTFCTELLRAGENIEDVRDRMGHTDIRTTQTYLHPSTKDARITDSLVGFASDKDL